ncbi:hypothetical protein [Psychrobacter sp. FDAARGOS_221]|uniref:hypothetical protein n=1 Tax=Psychrobacter sp. FDAARGOS_221 TaxID=1975705 RepID=UPI000BB58FD6|nr:hypothetical protein [Psychrobacter sp. FDAARGOS_221]PNK61690.1 hypothetical protein A6J60_012990 [Psychrobacter sp. FDAARGOS_221]
MPFEYVNIDCQQSGPPSQYLDKRYTLVKCVFKNKVNLSKDYHDKAWALAQQVNPKQANDAVSSRDKQRLIQDALGGVLAEYGWFHYINRVFGDNSVSFTEMKQGEQQIDLKLSNGTTIEVRSSFPRNGIEFAVCHSRHQFKNICKYENLYKLQETAKDFFACVYFETQKDQLLAAEEIVFYLVGGSTRDMMLDDSIAYDTDLVAEDDLTQQTTKYKVINISNALDISGFEQYMQQLGYQKNNTLF